jgi:hypothetical protein
VWYAARMRHATLTIGAKLAGLAMLAGLLGLLGLAGCAAPGEKQCTEACLRYSKLYQDEKWAGELAEAATPAEREKLEADKAAEWDDVVNNPERGLGACVASCNRMLRQGMVDCLMKAETLAQAKECDKR